MPPHVLLVGGHGKVSQRLTPLLLSKSWTVTSLIRNGEQSQTIEALGHQQPGKLNVIVHSLEEIQTEKAAREIVDMVGAPWVVWSAGAGGRGGPTVTNAVDNVAARAFASAAVSSPKVTHYLSVSYTGSRRNKPSWWDDDTWAEIQRVNNEVLPAYAKAKLAAEDHLTVLAASRPDFAAVSLRPGLLTLDPAGKVQLGRVSGRGKVSREGVATAIAALLERAEDWKTGKCTWLDLLDGDEEVGKAAERCLKEGVDDIEGEDFELMKREADKSSL